jgi:flagellar hook-length control protein FliK
LAVPVAGAKLAAKSSSPAKSSNDAAAPVTPVAETGETNADAAIEPAPSDAAPPEPRANAPQTDARNARTEATFTLSGEAAAPSASQTSAAPPSVTPSLATSVSGGAPISQARTPETAPAATQVAQEIVRRFDGDTTHFEVRLDPPELGRVEVRLEVSRDNKVSATVVADSPQTLVELARHARDLQNSLQAAGLDLADHGLSFDLRDSGREARDARSEASRTFEPGSAGSAEDASPRLRAGGLDPWRGRTLDMTA